MSLVLPQSLTANGNPFRQPVAFPTLGVIFALNPQVGITNGSDAWAVGLQVHALDNGHVVLADAAASLESNGTCVRVMSGSQIAWSTDTLLDKAQSGVVANSVQKLWLGPGGTILAGASAPEGFTQRIGTVVGLNVDTTNRLRLTPEPAAALL